MLTGFRNSSAEQDGYLRGFETPERLRQTNEFHREALKGSELR